MGSANRITGKNSYFLSSFCGTFSEYVQYNKEYVQNIIKIVKYTHMF